MALFVQSYSNSFMACMLLWTSLDDSTRPQSDSKTYLAQKRPSTHSAWMSSLIQVFLSCMTTFKNNFQYIGLLFVYFDTACKKFRCRFKGGTSQMPPRVRNYIQRSLGTLPQMGCLGTQPKIDLMAHRLWVVRMILTRRTRTEKVRVRSFQSKILMQQFCEFF